MPRTRQAAEPAMPGGKGCNRYRGNRNGGERRSRADMQGQQDSQRRAYRLHPPGGDRARRRRREGGALAGAAHTRGRSNRARRRPPPKRRSTTARWALARHRPRLHVDTTATRCRNLVNIEVWSHDRYALRELEEGAIDWHGGTLFDYSGVFSAAFFLRPSRTDLALFTIAGNY